MFEKLLKKICSELNKSKIPYMIIGGHAVLVYGEPRVTKDIDITLGINIDKITKIEKIVEKLRFKHLVSNIKEFVKKTMVMPVIDENSGIRIDFIFSYSLYERQAIKRAKKIKIGGTQINYASLEDTIIHKIVAGRARDIEDVKSIILKNANYNKKYIQKWLKKFEISLGQNFYIKFLNILKSLQE